MEKSNSVTQNISKSLELAFPNEIDEEFIETRITQSENNKKALYIGSAIQDPKTIKSIFDSNAKIPYWIFNLKTIKNVYIEMENGNKYKLKLHPNSILLLLTAMESGNIIRFHLTDEGEIGYYLILPSEDQNDVEKFFSTFIANKFVFFKNNDVWNVRFDEEFIQFKDFKGANYIYYLLQNPHKECPLWELHTAINKLDYEAIDAVSDPSANLKSTDDDEDKKKSLGKLAPYNEVNEAYNTLNKYKKEVERYDDLIEEAAVANDIEMLYKIEKLKKDRAIIVKEINRIDNEISHKNFNRDTDNRDEDKIRQAISQAYKQFKRTIKTDKTRNLHKHLTRSIVTGKEYKYDPEGSKINWVLDL